MIKSSWFYVKFKYAEKVSQYVFSSQGKPTTSSRLLLLLSSSGYSGKQVNPEALFVNVCPLL